MQEVSVVQAFCTNGPTKLREVDLEVINSHEEVTVVLADETNFGSELRLGSCEISITPLSCPFAVSPRVSDSQKLDSI
jgi:hypothetical protein